MNGLPSGWAECTLEDIADINMGQSPPGSSYTTDGEGMPFLQGNAEFGPVLPTPVKRTTEPKKTTDGRAVLLSVRAPVGDTNLSPGEVAIGRGLAAITPRAGTDRRFFLWLLRAKRQELERKATGTTFPAVTAGVVRSLPVWLPPQREQVRIVKAIETQEARIGDGEQSLAEAYKLATVLSQAILDAAARADGTIRPLEDCLLEPLMNGRSVRTAQEGFPVLRLTALKHGHIDVSEAKVGAWTELEASPYLISAGDFLVARGNGSLNLVGRGGLVEGTLPPVAFPDTLIRVRVDPDVLRPDFLRLVWDSRDIRAQIETQARTTAGIYKINQGHVRAIQLPVPGLDEQDRIVSRAQRQVAALDQLLTALDRQRRTVTQLRRSLLNRAFSGALVAQDHADESAFELLRRIRDDHGATDPQLEAAAS